MVISFYIHLLQASRVVITFITLYVCLRRSLLNVMTGYQERMQHIKTRIN